MLEDEDDVVGCIFVRRAAVMQSSIPRAAWVCAPAGVLYLELQLPFMSSRLHQTNEKLPVSTLLMSPV